MSSLKYTLEEAVSAWRRASRVVTFTSARANIKKNVIDVTVNTSQRNFAREESVKSQLHYIVCKEELKVLTQTITEDVSNVRLKAHAHTKDLVAVVRETPDTKSSDKKALQVLEIWKNGYLHSAYDMQKFDKHGKVYTDGTFGCLEFSPDDKSLVYLAEQKEPKKQSYLQFGLTTPSEGIKVGAEYEFAEDWGEQLVGKSQPVICLYKVDWEPFEDSSPIQVLDVHNEWSPGQLTWCSNEQLTGVAWYHKPRRLGLIYCTNRPSRLFKLNISTGHYDWFGCDNETALCPRFNSKTNTTIYLKSLAYGPHHKEQHVVVIDESGKMRVVQTKQSESYLGMYGQSFPDRCWSSNGKFVVFSSPLKSSIQSYALDIESCQVYKLPVPAECTGSVVLDVIDDLIVVTGVSLTNPDRIFIGRINFDNPNAPIDWKCLTSGNVLLDEFKLASDKLSFEADDGCEYEAILVYPVVVSGKIPIIAAPHGGPHSVMTDQFSLGVYFFAQLGYATLLINYRGSTGFGEAALTSLLGKIGTNDVDDCHKSTIAALKKHTFLDEDRVFLFGGSHGGFLVTHLSGQYPDFYRAVSTRNPVTDLTSMFPITDITDWTLVEGGLGDGSDLEKRLSPELLATMLQVSPIRYVSQLKAPTLLLVGKVDRRVPPTQSIEYYRALQLHGKPAKIIFYEDNHAISQVPYDTDALINTVMWFKQSVEQTV